MTLGEQIHQLRTARGLSQGDVADALDVSRQSVSKWETDSSVPELEKLLGLSELFGVTLDALVRGGESGQSTAPEAPQTDAAAAPPAQTHSTRKIIGVILLCFGVLICLLMALLADAVASLLFASPFFLCGVLCLLIRKNTGLWCAWAVFGCVSMYLYFATGITWRLLLLIPIYTASMNYARLVIACVHLLLLLLLVALTVIRFSKKPLPATKRGLLLLIAGWAAFIGSFFIRIPLSGMSSMAGWLLCFLLIDAPRCALLTVLLTFTVRLLRTRRATRKS